MAKRYFTGPLFNTCEKRSAKDFDDMLDVAKEEL